MFYDVLVSVSTLFTMLSHSFNTYTYSIPKLLINGNKLSLCFYYSWNFSLFCLLLFLKSSSFDKCPQKKQPIVGCFRGLDEYGLVTSLINRLFVALILL